MEGGQRWERMSEALDRTTASRATLRALVAAQQATIATLTARIADLERRLGASGGQGVPGLKATQRSTASGRPRTRRDRGAARLRMPPTQTVPHAAATCPDCGTRLAGGWVKRHREVIELPAAPVTVTDHQLVARTCPRCQRLVLSTDPLAGRVARMGQGADRAIRDRIRGSPWVHPRSMPMKPAGGSTARTAPSGASRRRPTALSSGAAATRPSSMRWWARPSAASAAATAPPAIITSAG